MLNFDLLNIIFDIFNFIFKRVVLLNWIMICFQNMRVNVIDPDLFSLNLFSKVFNKAFLRNCFKRKIPNNLHITKYSEPNKAMCPSV